MLLPDSAFDPFAAWSRGWAQTREVPPPVPHGDGFRIAVGLPRQAARYVFPHASPLLRELGATISQPWVFLKACASADELRALLPGHWQMQPDAFMMTCDDAAFPDSGALAPGYALQVTDEGSHSRRGHARVLAHDGGVAASGHIALDRRLAIYDRIVTEPAHQRRGLGRAVMRALQALAHAHGRHAGVLVATPQGRALYESLGWRLHAPWATAVIPDETIAP
jgi:GNAT superfamily N-acetyltransferase